MNILAIETSCDETSVAIVQDGKKILSLVVNSQIDIHAAYGGVIPEIAARSHIEVMLPVVEQALDEAFGRMENGEWKKDDGYWDKIDAIAVTQGPGLLGSLLIGVVTARTLAWAKGKPLYPVHHILGHVYANWITDQPKLDEFISPTTSLQLPTSNPEFPALALIVSGGHAQLMYGQNHNDWRVIGRTQDDAVGEAFDKVAKVLGLPYPGGPSVAKMAVNGDPKKYQLPTPKVDTVDQGLIDVRGQMSDDRPADSEHTKGYNFSFSGLKTAVLRAIQKDCGVAHDYPSFRLAGLLTETQKADFAASFQMKAIDYLVSKTKQAFDEFSPKTVIIGGGVAASLPLRKELSKQIPIEIQYAPQILCTDNAAMIGARAYYQTLTEDPVDPHTLEVQPSWPL